MNKIVSDAVEAEKISQIVIHGLQQYDNETWSTIISGLRYDIHKAVYTNQVDTSRLFDVLSQLAATAELWMADLIRTEPNEYT